MKVKLRHICILAFWAVTLIASPVSLLCLPDEDVSFILSNASDEEAGEPFKAGPDVEILFAPLRLPSFASWNPGRAETPAVRPATSKDIVCDVVLPPPEGRLL